MIDYVEACERVLRFERLNGNTGVFIHRSKELDTHWLLTYAVPSIEDPSRVFQYGDIIVEKHSGNIFYPPSRSERPIRWDEFPLNRELFGEITLEDLLQLEKELSKQENGT